MKIIFVYYENKPHPQIHCDQNTQLPTVEAQYTDTSKLETANDYRTNISVQTSKQTRHTPHTHTDGA